jgi:cell division transport system permease protein
MANGNNFLRARTRSTFLTSMFIIALVLFFLGLLAASAIYSRMLLENAQENFELMVTLPDHTPEAKRIAFGDYLKNKPFVKELNYISKDDAGKIFVAEMGDEFMEIMDGVNPLPASYNFTLKLAYINSDSLAKINQLIEEQPILTIQDITYPIGEIEQLRKNIGLMSKVAIGIAILVALIAFFIVNSTVRLAIFGRRLMIRSMELIGATAGFIRRPFLRMGILQGFFGALLSLVILTGLVLGFGTTDLSGSTNPTTGLPIRELLFRSEFMFMLGGILIFGTFLGWFSSWWAVNRFLNKNLNQLM